MASTASIRSAPQPRTGTGTGTEARIVQLHGHDVAYRTAGTRGPVVVLVHGMASSSATWDAVIPGLAERFTVIAPDLPGHGESAKPVDGDYSLGAFASSVRDLMLALGHHKATIVGQSLGGGVAMQFAYQFPSRCERLVLVGSGGLGREVTPLLRALALPGVDLIFPVLFASVWRSTGQRVFAGLRRVGLEPSSRTTEIWRSYEALTDPDTRTAFGRTLRSVVDVGGQRVSARNRLPLADRIPMMIVWGEDDAIIPSSHAADAHASLPSSRIEIFEGVGHFPHCEAPERFREVLTDFIDTTDPADVTEEHFVQLVMAAASA